MKKIVLILLFLGFLGSLQAVENRINALGLDLDYTLTGLYNLGPGIGVTSEFGFLDVIAFTVNVGYQRYNGDITGGVYTSDEYYAYAGFKYYMNYDAPLTTYVGVFVGVNDEAFSGTNVANLIIPIEVGMKLYLEKNSGIYWEPNLRIMLYPRNQSTDTAFLANFRAFLGISVGFLY